MRTFRIIGMALVAIMMCISYTACSSDSKEEPAPPQKKPIEEFNQGNMSFTEGAGEQSFSFVANEAWTISVAATKADEAWCKVSPTSGGAGSHVVKIATTENTSYDDRSVTITLKSGSESKSFVVTQKQKDALLLTSDKVEIEQKGGTFTIEVKANVSYTATIGETCKSWIAEGSNTRALSTSTKTYSVAINEESEKREGTITFTAGDLSETVHIYQAGGDIILLTKDEYYVDAAGENITIELKSNCDYEVEMPNVDWIHTTSTRGMSSHTLYYTIDANEGYDSREAKITYRNKANNVVETLTIIQAQKDAIILGKKEVTVKAEGETIEVKLSTNVDYKVVMPEADWISSVSTRALTEHTLHFKIAKNENENSRTAQITFRNKEKNLEDVLSITQEGTRQVIEIHNPEAGKLSDIIQREDLTALKITGYLGGGDFMVLQRMKKIKFLDLSETDVLAGYIWHREPYGEYSNRFEANTISSDAFRLGYYRQDKVYEELEELLLPNSVTTIENSAFHQLPSLRTIKLPNKLEKIGASAFSECNYLTIITIPDNVKEIDDYAFADCKNLTEVYLSRSLKELPRAIFSECSKLKKITLHEGLTKIGERSFEFCKDLEYIEIPSTVIEVGDNAFWDNENLKTIIFHEGLQNIKRGAFIGCRTIKSIQLPNSVTYIGDNAFNHCTSLSNITLPQNLTTINDYTFAVCPIDSITIPKNMTKIAETAFPKVNTVKIFCTTPPKGYIECKKLYIPKGTYQKYFLSKWATNNPEIIEMDE